MLVYTNAFHASESNSVWVYTETSSKNRPGGASALKASRKDPLEEGERCFVLILGTYTVQVPPSVISHDIL